MDLPAHSRVDEQILKQEKKKNEFKIKLSNLISIANLAQVLNIRHKPVNIDLERTLQDGGEILRKREENNNKKNHLHHNDLDKLTAKKTGKERKKESIVPTQSNTHTHTHTHLLHVVHIEDVDGAVGGGGRDHVVAVNREPGDSATLLFVRVRSDG